MKRFIWFVVLIFIVIFGGFLILDKFFFHLIIKPVPGSCLILEEKYCKTGELRYVNNLPIGITYKVKTNAPLFSPINNNYSTSNAKDKNNNPIKLFIVGKQNFEGKGESFKRDWYQIFFSGEVLNGFSTNNIGAVIEKGKVFAFTSKVSENNLIDVIFIPKSVFLDDLNNVKLVDNTEEMLNIFNKSKK